MSSNTLLKNIPTMKYISEYINLKGESYKFDNDTDLEEFYKSEVNDSPEISHYRHNTNFYIKIRCDCDPIGHHNEVRYYKILSDTVLTPKLIYSEVRVNKLNAHFTDHIYEFPDDQLDTTTFIVLENKGKSILDLYFSEDEKKIYSGPGYASTDLRGIKTIFPQNKIPPIIMDQVFTILDKLHSMGLEHHDIHPGNFIVDNDGKVYIIDLESMDRIGFPISAKYSPICN